MAVKQFNFPLQRTFWTGTLIENHISEGYGPWIDCMGMYEAKVVILGMFDDEIAIEGTILEKPEDRGGFDQIGKAFTDNGTCTVGGYRKYRVNHSKASGNPVTVHFFGSN